MNEKWFSLSVAECEQKLKTNAASGLSRKAARSAWYREERITHAFHVLFVRKQKNAGKMLCEIFADFALVLLLCLALLSVFFGERTVGYTVLGICIVSLCVSFACYYRAQRSMEQMNLYFLPTAKVIRGGKLYRVSFENIVRGDVIILEQGDIVPADARLITSDSLTVSMRVDKERYITLRKQAEGAVLAEEKNPVKHLNILHAGSVIINGSARALVYATGTYTYLGAMCGEIPEPYSSHMPTELKKMKKTCSKISLISMLCILPFCALSILLSNVTGGTATLSLTFLTALSISASCMTQLSCTLCKVFFIIKIKDLLSGQHPCAVRTTDAFDKLCGVTSVFMLDGSALTDGILHFDCAFTAEGEAKSFTAPMPTNTLLFDLVSLYNSAESGMLTLGLNLPDRFSVGLGEFLSFGHADAEALKIRCPLLSYMTGSDSMPIDRVFYSDSGKKMVLHVARTPDILMQCSYAVVSGQTQKLSSVGADKLKHTYKKHIFSGKTVLIFALSTLEDSGKTTDKIFVGAVVLREGIDKNAAVTLSSLEARGIKVVGFVNNNSPANIPKISTELRRGSYAKKEEFIKNGVPITYRFGEISTYYDFEEKDILTLLRLARSEGGRVAVIAFSDLAPRVSEAADVFISCSPIVNVLAPKTEEELYTTELAGAANSLSATQTVKSKSDMLIERPNGKSGGISAVIDALPAASVSYRNLMSFFKYTLAAQLLRIIIVGLPMAVGKPILDARHVLFCSFIIDIFVLLMLANDKSGVPKGRTDRHRLKGLREHIVSNKVLMLSVLSVSVFAVVFPILIDMTNIFGVYLYKVEYMFCTLLWLQLLLAYYIRYGSITNVYRLPQNKIFTGLLIGVILFAVCMLVISPLGQLFDVFYCPLPYMIATLLPSVAFILLMELLPMTGIKK